MRALRRLDIGTSVHPFGRGPGSRALLGGDGAGLARLQELGLPTPPGFTVSTAAWRAYATSRSMPGTVRSEIQAQLEILAEHGTGVLRGHGMPLLLTVRAGSPASVPGLLAPIVDLGMGEAAVAAVTPVAGSAFAGTRWQAFLRGFGTEVRGLPAAELEAELRVHDDPLSGARALRDLIATRSGAPVPDDLDGQLDEALAAAWDSWDRPAVVAHRRRAQLSDDLGVAVVVQTMVHGDRDSGAGTAFSRDPDTGVPRASASFVPATTAVDGPAAHRLPLTAWSARAPGPTAALDGALALMEASCRDMCAVDFAVDAGRLWILRAEPGPRSGPAAVRIAVDLVDDGLITPAEALARIPSSVMAELQAPAVARELHTDALDLCIDRVLQWADERGEPETLDGTPAAAATTDVLPGPS